jgi:hypothetical protein
VAIILLFPIGMYLKDLNIFKNKVNYYIGDGRCKFGSRYYEGFISEYFSRGNGIKNSGCSFQIQIGKVALVKAEEISFDAHFKF